MRDRAAPAGGCTMSRLQGFRCPRCRLELLVRRPAQLDDASAAGWTPPLVCCGLPLRPLPLDHVPALPRRSRRDARCPGCGYSVQIIVRPAGPLLCAACRQALTGGVAPSVGPTPPPPDPGDHGRPGERPAAADLLRREVIRRLIVQGPDRLAGHIYRRLCADRVRVTPIAGPRPLAWAELAQWARLEGLVTEAEARLLGASPVAPAPLDDGGEPVESPVLRPSVPDDEAVGQEVA